MRINFIGTLRRRFLRPAPPTPTTLEIHSSDAVWKVDGRSGQVLAPRPDEALRDQPWLRDITRFDVSEYRHWCAAFDLAFPRAIDIVAIGYWLANGRYEPAEADARVDIVAAQFDI